MRLKGDLSLLTFPCQSNGPLWHFGCKTIVCSCTHYCVSKNSRSSTWKQFHLRQNYRISTISTVPSLVNICITKKISYFHYKRIVSPLEDLRRLICCLVCEILSVSCYHKKLFFVIHFTKNEASSTRVWKRESFIKPFSTGSESFGDKIVQTLPDERQRNMKCPMEILSRGKETIGFVINECLKWDEEPCGPS